MNALLSFLCLTFLTLVTSRSRIPTSTLPGDMGYMLGTQMECDDFFCQMAHLSVLNYTIPPPAEHKGVIEVNFTASYPGPDVMFMPRFTAYDSNTGRYFVLTIMDGVSDLEYTLYTIKIFNNPPAVTSVAVTQASKLKVTSMQYDTVDNILYIVFDTNMYSMDPTSGNLKRLGALTTQPEIQPGLTTAYDSNLHIYWISVDDDAHATKNLLSYYTRNQTSSITGNLNNGDYWYLYAMSYYPKLDQLIAITDHDKGWPSVKLVDYRTGQHVDLVPEFIWSDYDVEFSLWPQSSYTNQIVWMDNELNIFWFTVRYTDPEMTEYEALVYYNLTKGGTEMGSGPMVLYENALMFTNMVWFHWNNTF